MITKLTKNSVASCFFFVAFVAFVAFVDFVAFVISGYLLVEVRGQGG